MAAGRARRNKKPSQKNNNKPNQPGRAPTKPKQPRSSATKSKQPRSSAQNDNSPATSDNQNENINWYNSYHNNSNTATPQDIKKLQDSIQILQQQLQQVGLNHQLLMGKYDAEISKLTLEVQTLTEKVLRNSKRIRSLKGKLARKASLQATPDITETITSITVQPKPKKMRKPPGSEKISLKKKQSKVPEEPTTCSVCLKVYKKKGNFEIHQMLTKHGLEDTSIMDFLSASATSTSNISPESLISETETLLVGDNLDSTLSQSNKHSDPSVEIIAASVNVNFVPETGVLNDDASNCAVPDPKANLTSVATKLSESLQSATPEKQNYETEIVSLISEDEDVPIVKKEKHDCPSCRLSFSDEGLLNHHIKTSCQEFLVCKICGKKFQRARSLKLHQLKEHKQPKALLKCPTCSKSFTCASTLQMHKELHLNERPFECVHCGKTYRKQSSLDNHTKEAHQSALKFFCCTVCPKTFVSEKFLEKHIHSHPVCSKCSRLFTNDDRLARHFMRYHVRLQNCHYCQKDVDQEDWKEHCSKCQGKQPVKCSYCLAMFRTPACLKRHTKSRHEGLPYKKAGY